MTPEQRQRVRGYLEAGLKTSEVAELTGVAPRSITALKAWLSRPTGSVRPVVGGLPHERARETAKWARTMTKWQISRAALKRKWEVVNFTGPAGRESRGIVDLMAIRKDHRTGPGRPPRGDFFEIILVQVKGGGAPDPSADDVGRLIAVARRYGAKDVILATWRKGREPQLRNLKSDRGTGWRRTWCETTASSGVDPIVSM